MRAYRQVIGGGWMFWVMGLTLLIMAGGTAVTYLFPTPEWVFYVMCGSTALVALFAAVFRRLTLRVDEKGVRADWGGVFSTRVPLDDIAEVSVEPYRWLQFGGWGWRFNFAGDVAYSQLGVSQALIIRRRSNGKRLVVTLNDPQQAADAISDWMGA